MPNHSAKRPSDLSQLWAENDARLSHEPPEALRNRRVRLGLSQSELARLLGVHPNVLARWERGELTIAHPRILDLALTELARRKR